MFVSFYPNRAAQQPHTHTNEHNKNPSTTVLRQVHAGDDGRPNQPDECRQHAGRHLSGGGIVLEGGEDAQRRRRQLREERCR